MTKRVSFAGLSAELAEPAGNDKVPAIVLLQEYWGVNGHIRDLADRFAAKDFLVAAPDLYHGKIATNAAEAGKLMTELDTLTAVKEIGETATFLKAHPRCNGKVGVTGFCLGGALSFAAACHLPDLSAVVAFYGIPPAQKVDYANVTAPVMAHFARHDDWATVEKAEAIKAALEARSQPMELHVYDAPHAFVNDTRPEVYDEASAKLALERTFAFFQKHLG